MKEIKIDPVVERIEKYRQESRQAQKEAFDEAMKKFRESPAYHYVMGFFENAERRIADEIEKMQKEDLKKVFILRGAEKTKKIDEMSKRHALLTGLLGIVQQVKSRVA